MYTEKKITYNDFENVSEIFDVLSKIQNETENEELKNQIPQFKQFLTDVYTPSLNFERTTNLVEEIVYNSSTEQVTVTCSYYRDENGPGEQILEIILQGESVPYIITETSTRLETADTRESCDAVKRILSKYLVNNSANPLCSIGSTSNESNQADGTMFVTEEQIETVVKRIIKSVMD